MPLTTLSLGAVNLNDSTKYIAVWEGDQGWQSTLAAQIVPLRISDGARLGSSRIAETKRVFNVVCLGATYAVSRANADAIDAELLAARNYPRTGTAKLYIEQDTSDGTPDTWKVLAGVFQRLASLRPAGLIEGTLTLQLSKA